MIRENPASRGTEKWMLLSENQRGENQRGQMYSIILGVKISGRFLSVEMICSYRSVCTRGSHAVSLRHGNGERWVCDVSVGRPARSRPRPDQMEVESIALVQS